MIEILENIKTAIELSIVSLTLIGLIILAPGVAFSWMKKLLILTLVLQVFALFVPSLTGIKIFMLYIMNLATYKMFPESFWLFSQQMFVLFVSWQILLWIIGRENTNAQEQTIERSEGFTTRRL